ncbi:osteoclast-associated immunoglobulin-like receptor isoform X1 [Manis pentadactyla]|uniref:osteoclast-associated immunoglobulin-like receptor isoform X1 n=1 Tax=Manis pentadactyla TaxID=143292 RepID=UPI00255D133D|nr:osteoclast-associated immunoglobulin-like receptor isoform X1 [Manis pentadactyla]
MAMVLALQLLTLCEPLQHLLSGSLAKLVQTASLWAPRHLSGERARDKTIGASVLCRQDSDWRSEDPGSPISSAPPASYRKPLLGAQPAEVVTPGVNVTLRCLAPQPAWKFVLFKSGEIPRVLEQNVSVELAEFFLEEVTPAQGGSYRCCYQRPGWELGVWSLPSNTVELLVTDELPQPGLEALPGAPLALRCSGGPRGLSSALYLEGRATPLQDRRSAQPWADFALGARAAGTYSRYYRTPSAPSVLSPRSEPLAVRPDGSPDYTLGNLIRLGLAGLVLLSLAMLVVVDWRSQTGAPGRIQP